MAERKAIQKYYPPDFDPSLISKTKRRKGDVVKPAISRIMLPITVQCKRCGDFIYKGKKFNARKEESKGDAYLGIKVWKFYFKCSACMNEIILKTDPKNADYTIEAGANRNSEAFRDALREQSTAVERRQADEANDAMIALENKTLENQRQMESKEQLEDLLALNSAAAAAAAGSTDAMLLLLQEEVVQQEEQMMGEEEEELLIQQMFGSTTTTSDGKIIKRLKAEQHNSSDDDDSDNTFSAAKTTAAAAKSNYHTQLLPATAPIATLAGVMIKKKTAVVNSKSSTASSSAYSAPAVAIAVAAAVATPATVAAPATLSSLIAYGSSSDDD